MGNRKPCRHCGGPKEPAGPNGPGSGRRRLLCAACADATCLADGCDRTPRGPHSLCARDYRRWRQHGDPNHVEPQTGNPKGDAVGYHGVHLRLYKLYGNATEHDCRQCGRRADTWAYDHADQDERQDPKRGPYSIDPAHHLPLCHSCHGKLDRKAPPKTHCPQGHPYDKANTRWRNNGWRDCRACNRERARRNALKGK